MAVMVLLTTLIGFVTVKVRFASVRNGDVRAKYYKLMQGDNVPEIVIKTSNSFKNQFEIPVLFYTVSTLYISLSINSSLALAFAWLFVFFRCIHAYIHITYNHVLHRLIAFWLAFICVIVLWLNLLIQSL